MKSKLTKRFTRARTDNITLSIKLTFYTASFVWQVDFSNHNAHIKFCKTSSVNLPLTNEVTINTMFHASENSGFLRNAIYAFAIHWCRAADVGGWLVTFRFNILTPCSEIKQSKQTVGHSSISKCTKHSASDDRFWGTGALVTTVNPSAT